jgi:Na+:H+ antiporter, NhaA family
MSAGEPPLSHSWLASDRPVPRLIARPMRRFLDTEAAGGVVLLAATLVALITANSPFGDHYERIWSTRIGVEVGGLSLSEDLRHWINDGLMAIFFFVVGLEIKRELIAGELRTARRAALPAIAALGGMVVPALIYVAFNAGGAVQGWGVPMATDIAFAVGVLALLGRDCPPALKVLLLSVAIVDDIGAIFVIAAFYTDEIQVAWLVGASTLTGLTVAMRRLSVWWTPAYVIVGSAVWLATLQSGIHATIAGVVLGLLAPALPADREGAGDALSEAGRLSEDPDPESIKRTTVQAQELVSVAERLEHSLHPWSSFLIVPVFALANAGVRLSIDGVGAAFSSRVFSGIVLGLVVGKLVGITAAAWLAVRLRIGALPEGLGWRHVVGCGAVAGIGFTVALFIAELAFGGGDAADEAKVGILVASVLAASLGTLLLRRVEDQRSSRRSRRV